jgi:hypothetical protein
VDPVFLLLAWELEEVSEHPSVNGEDPELKALLNRHGVLAEPFMGIAGKVKFYETLVFQGDRIAAYGHVAEQARTVNAMATAAECSTIGTQASYRPLGRGPGDG